MEEERIVVHRNREVGKAFSQITLDDDYNLPDYKPDLMKVIQEKGQLLFDEIHVSNGHVWFKGTLEFFLLYRTDLDSRQMNCLKGEIPFQESLSIDGAEESDQVRLEGRIEDISVSVINSRKLSIRSLTEFRAAVERLEENTFLTAIGDADNCEVEKEEVECLELLTNTKDTLRFRNELPLSSNKPNMEEILWSSVELRGVHSRLKNGEIDVTGEALVSVLYSGTEEEERLQWFETTVPIAGAIDCNLCEETAISRIQVDLAQKHLEMHTDEDGEQRVLLLEMVLNLNISLWKEMQFEIISDLYALDRQVKPEFARRCFETLRIRNEAKCKIADTIEMDNVQGDILQICTNEENLVIEQTTVTEEGVLVEGVLTVNVLYLTGDDMAKIGAKRAYLPFSQVIEMPQGQNSVRIQMDGRIEQVTTILADNRTIDVKAVIGLQLLAFDEQQKEIITGITEEAIDLVALQQRPGLVGYIVKEGDRLFGIAKENHTTVQDLIETNHLPGEALKAGDKLLIVKAVGKC